MSGDEGHTFTSVRPMKAFRGYAVREQEGGQVADFIRNGCFGGRKAGNQLIAGGVPQKTVYEVCFGSGLRSDALKGEMTRGESQTPNRQAASALPRKMLYYKTRPHLLQNV